MTTRTPHRFHLAILMGLIGAIAVGLAGMRVGSELAERVALHFTLAALLVGLLGAIVRRADGAWAGFALFGWSHLGLAFLPHWAPLNRASLISSDVSGEVVARLHPDPRVAPTPPTFSGGYVFQLRDWQREGDFGAADLARSQSIVDRLTVAEREMVAAHIRRIDAHEKARDSWIETMAHAEAVGQALSTLIFALIGAVLGRSLADRPTMAGPSLGPDSPTAGS